MRWFGFPNRIPSLAGLELTPPDTDNDNKPNPYDLDSNNNGITDLRGRRIES